MKFHLAAPILVIFPSTSRDATFSWQITRAAAWQYSPWTKTAVCGRLQLSSSIAARARIGNARKDRTLTGLRRHQTIALRSQQIWDLMRLWCTDLTPRTAR